MADYISTGRSNYFRVKEVDAFKALCNLWSVEFIDKKPVEGGQPDDILVGFLANSGLSLYRSTDEPANEDNVLEYDFDAFLQELAAHLMEEEVAVMMESGYEGMRYVSGFAIAVNSKGEKEAVYTEDIYEKAVWLGKNITKAER